jgi:uncharacterized YigZ family protein
VRPAIETLWDTHYRQGVMSRHMVPKSRCRAETRVSNSRFLATIAPAFSVKEAQEFIRAVRAEMPDASHHVYAFKIGYGASVSEGVSDAGEPSGTAGPPALAVLRGSDVGDVVLVITRYFGGTKLGTGGLVAAYTNAAKAAFDLLETVEKVIRVRFAVDLPYPTYDHVRRLLTEHDCVVEDECFAETVRLRFQIAEDRVAAFTRALSDLTAGKVALVPSGDS